MRALTKTLFLFTLLSFYLGPALSQSPETPETPEQTSDLALVLGAPTPITIAAGEAVEFPITVYNQGDTPAHSVVIANTIPFGFLLADSAWLQSGNVATTTLPEPLPAGASTNLSVTLQASELTPGDPCPDGESTFWDFAEIAGAGTSPDQPTPDVAVNAQGYTAQGAVVRLLPPVLNGAATIDEYFVDEVHLNGNFSVRTGVNISGAGGGPAPMQDNLVQTWVFDRPIADAAIFVNDVDGQDIAVINGYFNNRLIQLTPNDFNYEGVTPCPVFRGNNTFQSTTCSADDNTVQGGINIVVPGFINRLEIIYYDPNPNGGGSFSVNFQELCNSPIVDDCPFTNYAEVVYFEDATGNELIDRDSAEIVGADNDPNEVNDAFEDQADHDDLDFSVVVVGNKPENPVIGVAKRLAGATDNGDGSYDLRFAFTLENFGDVPLQNLVLVDDIVNQFDTVMPTNLSAVDGSLQASSSWDGTLQSNILAPGQSLALGESGTVFVEFTVSPGDIQAATNIAFATGTSPTGIPVTDISTDGTNPDPDGNNTPDEMVPTVVTFPPVILPPPEPTNTENPVIGLAKQASGITDNGDGTFTLSYELTVANLGDVELSNLTLVDDIQTQFDGLMPVDFLTIDGSLIGSTTWDGTATSNILEPGQSLPIGASGTVSIQFAVTPAGATSATNSATATGTSPDGTTVTDTSTDGANPDPDGDGNPDEMVPTVITFPPTEPPPPPPPPPPPGAEENPIIGLAKQASGIADNGDGTFTLSYELTVANLGDVELSNLTLVDDIQTQFDGLMPVDFLTIDGSLIGSTAWDGTATSNILEPGQSLPVGASGTVSIQFAVTPAGATSATNSATATGTSPDGTTVTDTSTDGANPDPNGDGNPDEMVPTVITFPPTMPPPPPPPPTVASENPVIGLAKQTTSLVDNADGSYQITFELNVGNFGDVPLRDLKIVDDIESQFAGLMPQGYRTLDGSLRGSALWNGTADINILAPGQSLDVGESGSISIQFNFTPGTATSVTNSATATGTSPDGTLVSDDSTDGANPDPNGDGNPEEMTPTVTPLQPVDPTVEPEPEIPGEPGVEAPVLGLAKALSGSVSLGDGSYLLTYEFTVENFGNIAINNLAVFDDVLGQFAELAPEQYRTAPGSLINSPTWNGSASSNLLAPGQTLAVGQQGNVFASFVVTPPRTMTVTNIATTSGTTPGGNPVEDGSTDGTDPDPDGNGDPAEMQPTVVGFELPPPGSIAGSVFEDTNLDGVADEDLTMFGIPQVIVSLLVPGPDGPVLVDSQPTAEDGSFLFPKLPTGNFIVEVTLSDIPENLELQTTPIRFDVELAPGEDREDLDFGFGAQPLAIGLEYFEATLTKSGVRIEWATAWEKDSLGYIVHRVHADGSMSPVNPSLILANGGGTIYRFEDLGATGGRYVLEELETDLDSNIQSIVAFAQQPAPPQSEPVLHQAAAHTLQFTTSNSAASHFVDHVSSNPQVLDLTDPESPVELIGEHLHQAGSHAVYFEAAPNTDILVQPRAFIVGTADTP